LLISPFSLLGLLSFLFFSLVSSGACDKEHADRIMSFAGDCCRGLHSPLYFLSFLFYLNSFFSFKLCQDKFLVSPSLVCCGSDFPIFFTIKIKEPVPFSSFSLWRTLFSLGVRRHATKDSLRNHSFFFGLQDEILPFLFFSVFYVDGS